jgi:DNA-3-methyladenine glycosylase II
VDREILARARRHLVRRDPVLANVIRGVGSCRWGDGPADHLFAGLVRAIVSQQLSSAAADTILRRICQLLPDERVEPGSLLAVPEATLRQAGLSTRKTEYLRDLSRRIADGEVRLEDLVAMSDAEVIRTLTSIRGVGQWTAEMMLIFRLKRPDVLPLDDVALLRAVQRAYGLRRRPTPRQFTRMAEAWRPWRSMAEAWRPWRSVACWYLWASLDRQA